MSKKIIYIRIIIAAICLLFISIFVFLIKGIQESININDVVIEETTEEEKIIFDMNLPPSEQKNLKNNVKEYFSQVYDYLCEDTKWKNIKESMPYDYSELRQKSDRENFYRILMFWPYRNLFLILFNSDDIDMFNKIYLSYPLNMDDLPVTENYKEKHPKPLYEEFDFIKKENYKHPKVYHGDYMDYWYDFFYTYGIGVNEENKEICVGEEKDVSKTFIEDDDGIERLAVARDKDGNEILAIETRNIYFKYTIDEKGYVDDIIYDRTEIITDDKYLDNIIKYE